MVHVLSYTQQKEVCVCVCTLVDVLSYTQQKE